MRPIGLAVAIILAGATTVVAAPYDGSTPLNCEVKSVMACMSATICVQGTSETELLPPIVAVNVPEGFIGGDRSGRKIKIVSVGHGPGRLLLHGQDLEMGTAWNLVIEETSGAATGAVLTRVGGHLLFGTCAAR